MRSLVSAQRTGVGSVVRMREVKIERERPRRREWEVVERGGEEGEDHGELVAEQETEQGGGDHHHGE